MCDEFIHPGLVEDTRLSRRTFGLIAAAAAGAAGTACAAAPKTAVDESDVSIKTSDGTADAVLFAPKKAGKSSSPGLVEGSAQVFPPCSIH